MMKLSIGLLLLLFLLAGCGTTYIHPTKNANDFERDKRECETIARKYLAGRGIPET